jgi:hypothetical protein
MRSPLKHGQRAPLTSPPITEEERRLRSTRQLFVRKPLADVQALGPLQLVMIGIGCIVGAGVT